MILSEAFRELDTLNEETFSLDKEGIKELDEFEKDDTFEDVEDIIDPNAETEDDLQDSYIGKVILDCCICHSKQYKDKEDVILNEDQTLANIEEECPFCYSTDGFKIIGEVTDFEADDDEDDEDDEDEDDKDENEKEDKDESLKESVNEAIENLSVDTDDTHMEMTSDDSGKVTITTEPRTDMRDEEMIKPIDDETKEEIEMNSEESKEDEEVDVEVDEFEEESFDELGESYLKKIYGNVESFKTTNVSSTKDKLIIEGLIKFNSGKSKNTTFIFESKLITKSGKVKFLGENKEITKGKKAFIIKGSIQNKKLITESLTYNYNVKNKDSKTSRLYGTVRTQKRG